MSLAQLLRPRRPFSLWRVVGPGTWIRVVLYTAVLTLLVGVYRSPALLTSLQDAGSVGAFLALLFGVVPLLAVPAIFVVVAVVVVASRLIRETRRSLGLDRRRRGGYAHHDGVDGGDFGGGLLGGLGGFVGGDGSVDGDDGDDE